MKKNVLVFCTIVLGLSSLTQAQLRGKFTSYKAENRSAVYADPVSLVQASSIVAPLPGNPTNANIASVITLGTSANGIGWGYGNSASDHIWVEQNTKTVTVFHRMGPGSTPPSLSGYIAVDRAANYGASPADWSLNYQIYAATLSGGGTYYKDAARYPQGAVYNPAGNTDPNNSYIVYFLPNLSYEGSGLWGGYSFGRSKWSDQADTTKLMNWYNPPPSRYGIPHGFTITGQGKAFAIDRGWDVTTQVYDNNLFLSTGTWNATTNDYSYTFSQIPCVAALGVIPMHVKIAADPTGNHVWICAISNNGEASPVFDETYYPIFYHSSDGGLTWSDPMAVTLDGPNGIATVRNYISDYRLNTVYGYVPPRDQIAYTTAFEGDLTVDKWGNPHFAVAIGLSAEAFTIVTPDNGNTPTFDSTMAVFDIFSTNQGASWCGRVMGINKRFRCLLTASGASATDDLRINISRNAAGDKIFVSYVDTWDELVLTNNAPDIFTRGWDLNTNKLTNNNGQDAATNVTHLSEISQNAFAADQGQLVFTKPDGSSQIPFVCEMITNANLDNPVTFKYIPDFSFAQSDFTINAGGQAWGTTCTFPTPQSPVVNFMANNLNPLTTQTVIFTDQSLNIPTSWQWSFNPSTVTYMDGTTAASQNPHVRFNSAGLYSVTLQATNTHGSGSQMKSNYVDVAQTTLVQRELVVMELGDGTWCTYCVGSALGEHDLLANGCQMAMINNHNGDTYNNTYSNARNSFYGIQGYPTAFFDGVLSVVGGNSSSSMYSTYLPKYQERYAALSPLTVDITGTASGNTYNITLTIHKVAAITASDIKAQLVLTESSIAENWFTQDHLDHVTRLMVPDANGSTVSFVSDDTQVINLSFTVDPGWVTSNCELIAFVQDNTSKEIFNGKKISLSTIAMTNPPTGLQATVAGNDVHLTWSAPVGVSGLTGYNVYRGAIKLNTSPVSTLFYDDNGLSNGTYSYTVKALYDMVESSPAGPVMAYIGAVYQGPVTIAGITGAPYNTTVSIPVTVNYFTNITALSLRMDYDPTMLTFTGYANSNSELTGIIVNDIHVSTTLHKILMIWSDLTPRTIALGGKLLDLNFTYLDGTAALIWNNTAGGGTECEYADAIGNPLPDTPTSQYYINGEVHHQPGYAVSGVFNYNNSGNTALDNIKVVLKQGTSRVDSVYTSATGTFNFPAVPNGIYKVLAYSTKPWSSVNATDAIKVQRHFAGLEILTEPVKFQAGDVNLSNSINGTDAIKIKRRFSGLDSFFDRGDWTFAKPTIGGDTIIVSGSPVFQDFYGLCVGDVNGSNVPIEGKSAAPSVTLIPEGEIMIKPGEEFDLPVLVQQDLELGAVSLILHYPADQISLVDVKMKQGTILYKNVGGELRISWSELESMYLRTSDPLIILRMKTTGLFSSTNAFTIRLMSESELADGSGIPIPEVILTAPLLKSSDHPGDFGKNLIESVNLSPNPAKNYVNLSYNINASATVIVNLISLFGQTIQSQSYNEILPGDRLHKINVSTLSDGFYFVTVKAEGENNVSSKTIRLIIRK